MIRGLLELQHLHRTTFAEWNGADMGVPDVVSKINITNTLQGLRDSLGWGVKATFSRAVTTQWTGKDLISPMDKNPGHLVN